MKQEKIPARRRNDEQKGIPSKKHIIKEPLAMGPLGQKKGQKIKIAFLDGKVMVGTLIQLTKYELVLEAEGKERPIVVFKHAVKYLY